VEEVLESREVCAVRFSSEVTFKFEFNSEPFMLTIDIKSIGSINSSNNRIERVKSL
jgi:hypothetical protein